MTTRTRDARSTPVGQACQDLRGYDRVIDARSPGEFALDHLPGAINLPVLDDAERALVGTLHKQTGAFEAKRLGAALVSRHIADHLQGPLAGLPRESRVLVYCWRGGNRSGALATVMARIGWAVDVLEGGYRAFRRQVIEDLQQLPSSLRFSVVAGRTGSGKSLILDAIGNAGGQVLDLEGLACHRGSVLGHLPEQSQPSQKAFETALWASLRAMDPTKPVHVESESRKVGQCQIPEALIQAIRASQGVLIEADDALRCELLMRDYRHFIEQPHLLETRLAALISHHGHARVDAWIALVRQGAWATLVSELLASHYDPAYLASMRRNFAAIAKFACVRLDGLDTEAMSRAATQAMMAARLAAASAEASDASQQAADAPCA